MCVCSLECVWLARDATSEMSPYLALSRLLVEVFKFRHPKTQHSTYDHRKIKHCDVGGIAYTRTQFQKTRTRVKRIHTLFYSRSTELTMSSPTANRM